MIDPAEILKRADLIVKTTDQWAAPPSADPAICAVVQVLCDAFGQLLVAVVQDVVAKIQSPADEAAPPSSGSAPA
jgi:hypothetical protein